MSLSEEARDRLADLVELQPTKNAELQERWGLDSGSDVHQYLESTLGDFYYRDENSMICATPEAEQLVGNGEIEPGERTVAGTELEARIISVLPGPDDDSQSVVATLHDIQEQTGSDPDVSDVRSALHTLVDKGLVKRVRKTVPTFRLALDRDLITIETDS